MAHPPGSLRASFDIGFDMFEAAPHLSNDKLKLSGASTAATDPPIYALSDVLQHWTDAANKTLNHIDSLPTSLLTEETLDQAEQSMYHHSEADVVRAAALYLLHPINQALSSLPYTKGTFKCQSELTAHNVRGDITYYKSPSGFVGRQLPEENMKAFLVIEFKRRGSLDPEQFRAATMPKTTHQHPGMKDSWISTHVVENNQAEYTTFADDARVVMKQAGSYAIAHGTQFVALFDWDQLVLVRFPGVDSSETSLRTRKANGVGEVCEVTIVSDTRLMRKTLLGFTMEAWHSTAI